MFPDPGLHMIVPLIAISAFLKLICCLASRLKKVLCLFSYTQAGKIAGFVCAKSHVQFCLQ